MQTNKLKVNFKFHGVGQGLFYSGSIINQNSRNFNFIYDCGTDTSDINLESKIAKCFYRTKDGNVIDCLFISHFHKDHISGVPYILKHYKVKNIFIPGLSPEEMVLACINSGINAASELYYMITNPIEYFENHSAENIFFIEPENEEENYSNLNNYNKELEDFYVSGEILPKRENADSYYSSSHINAFSCRKLNIEPYRTDWIFKIYQDYDREQQKIIVSFMESVYRLYSDIPLKDDMENAVKNKEFIKEINHICKKVKKDINQNSLVLYHSPIEKTQPDACEIYSEHNHHRCCNYPCCKHRLKKYPATLLTGDINLNTLKNCGNDFENFIRKAPNKIGFFQIPHHGSVHNTNISLLKKLLPPYIEMFCSYGIVNRYHHPSAYAIHQLMTGSCSSIHHIVEHSDCEYIMTFQ